MSASIRPRPHRAHICLGQTVMFFLILSFGGSVWTGAARVRALNIEQLTRKSDRIVSGRCLSVDVVEDPDLQVPVTVVTIDADRHLKGETGRTLTFRMLGAGSLPGLAGTQPFSVGEELILFLYPDGTSGLTSPVGLGQGRFRKHRDKDGNLLATRAVGNRALFDDLSPGATQALAEEARQWRRARALPVEVLVRMVEILEARSHRTQARRVSP